MLTPVAQQSELCYRHVELRVLHSVDTRWEILDHVHALLDPVDAKILRIGTAVDFHFWLRRCGGRPLVLHTQIAHPARRIPDFHTLAITPARWPAPGSGLNATAQARI